ncbi:MAG: hypothetical protein KDH96_03535 [Candidatus Riesia sp.]|nr:hypothetical protein [Candidatus Riesia sp.]
MIDFIYRNGSRYERRLVHKSDLIDAGDASRLSFYMDEWHSRGSVLLVSKNVLKHLFDDWYSNFNDIFPE